MCRGDGQAGSRYRTTVHNPRRIDMATPVDERVDPVLRPFTIETPEADLEDLRARLAATRWPEKETADDQ
jgi:hypothetical protein